MAVKGFPDSGGAPDDILAEAVIWSAVQGADVISMSWGGSFGTPVLISAMDTAFDEGVVLVAAAGNDNSPRELYPAAFDNVVAVAATDWNDQKASFSSYGDWVAVSAPGVNILSLRAEGTDMYGNGIHIVNETYYYASGTSMACPHVAGLAALMLAKNSSFSNELVIEKIIATTDYIDDKNVGFEEMLGSGRINAFNALPLDHNVGVQTTDLPDHVQANEVLEFNVTIINTGLNDETNVLVKLLVNYTEIDSVIIPFIMSNTIQNASLQWTPSLGWHNITIDTFIQDVTEEYYGDNEINKTVIAGVRNIDTGELFNTIQEAIDDADTSDGHVINVPQGVYQESVVIDKSLSLIGAGADKTRIMGTDPAQYNVYIPYTDMVNITGFGILTGYYGVLIESSSYSMIINNRISDNTEVGICLTMGSNDNQIIENDIINNLQGVVIASDCSDNHIYHNSFDNTVNAIDDGIVNSWDEGYAGFRPKGGNYWNDYTGTDEFRGPDQDEPGSDGVGDTPYCIPGEGNSLDNFPLMETWSGPLATTIFIDDSNIDGPWDGTLTNPFKHINNGVENATIAGDIIYVFNGTYHEIILIERPYISLIGEDKDSTIIEGDGLDYCIILDYLAHDCEISGFTINHSRWSPQYSGILILSKNNIISDNLLTNHEIAILIYGEYHSGKNMIFNNTCYLNKVGIYSQASHWNKIIGNKIIRQTVSGIGVSYSNNAIVTDNYLEQSNWAISQGWGHSYNTYISNNTVINGTRGYYGSYPCDNTTLTGNKFINNPEYGIYIFGYGTDNLSYKVTGNTVIGSEFGIRCWLTTRSYFLDNVITDCYQGIYFEIWCNENRIQRNRITGCEFIGFNISMSDNNDISGNTFKDNNRGLSFYNPPGSGEFATGNNIYHNNYIGNSVNAIGEANNSWDDGYPSGGNSWDDYTGIDEDMDGIGDTPYYFEDSSVDYYPLMNPYGSVKILPASYTIIRGKHIAGDLGDIYYSDDSRLTVNAGLTLMMDEPPVWIRLEGTVPSATPDWLEFTLEARAIGGSIVQIIELYNYETDSYEEIDERTATATDSLVEIYVSDDPSRFIDPDTLEMKAYLKWKPSGPLFVWPFTVDVDQSIWTIV
jgi:parallel beta-helix repeat protein